MSSASKKNISNIEAVPVVNNDSVFLGHEDQRFAIGVFSPEDIMSYEPNSVAQAYLRLRANVYVDQTNMLGHSVKRSDGTEIDEDDERSTHFVVFENRIGRVAVFACLRLIEKTSTKNGILPIEEFFPDEFKNPAPQKSIEVSRFIVRHDMARRALFAKQTLMTAGLAYALKNDLGPVFGVVEPGFERDLKLMGLPIRRIAEPKLVEEYNDENLGIEVDKNGLEKCIGKEAIDRMTIDIGSFGYWGHMPVGVESI